MPSHSPDNDGHAHHSAGLAVCLIELSRLQAQPKPQLIRPEDAARRDEQGVPLPDDVVRRLGSGLFRRSDIYAEGPPIVSPDGNTVYVTSAREDVAFDAKTGLQRFTYYIRGLSIELDPGAHDVS